MDEVAPVVRVELFEDRAAVTRRITLAEAGRNTLVIGPLTPLVDARNVSFPGGNDVVIEDVRATRRRQTRSQADPEALAELRTTWQAAHDRERSARDALQQARDAHKRSVAALDAASQATPRVLQERAVAEDWIGGLQQLTTHLRERVEAIAAAESALDHQAEEAARLQRDLEAARAGRPIYEGFLELSLLAEAPCDLLVRYIVPCALWRPAHRAELHTEDRGAERDQVSWELRAICWNATGEDWRGVELVCSTARPGDLAEPPTLGEDRVYLQARSEVVVEAREEEVHLAREPGSRTSAEVPGVDDGGETRVYVAADPVDIPSSGQPVGIPLDRWVSDARVRLVAFPERASAAVFSTIQANGSSRPLLAGPVALIRDGEGIGRGSIALVPSGEPFSLGWGNHDGVRIVRRRAHEVQRSKVTGRQTHTFRIELKISHVGSEACRLEVQERIPVSEIKDVIVSDLEATPPTEADADGFCRWTFELSPGDHQQVQLSYVVKAGGRVHLPFHGP